jgi:ribonuclease HI
MFCELLSTPLFGAKQSFVGLEASKFYSVSTVKITDHVAHFSTTPPHHLQRLLEIKQTLDEQDFFGAWFSKQMSALVAYVDGGSLGNPGPAGIGVVIEGAHSGRLRIAKWIGHQDNNVAEYVALLEALQCAVTLNATILHVYSDSEVMVKQMTGEYVCRSPRLYSLHWTCRKLARTFDFSISHLARALNAEANGLANSAARKPSQYLYL